MNMRALTVRGMARVALALVAGWCGAAAAEEQGGGRGASGADVAETVAQWGLLGTWAGDCATPPQAGNSHYTWVRRGREVFLDRDLGKSRDSNRVLAASGLPDGALELRIEFTQFAQTRINVLIKGQDGRVRVLTNQDTHGSYSVKDGRLTASGATTPWETRCR
jgi:hypothetical protein